MSSISSFLTSILFNFRALFVWSNLLIILLSIENSQSVEIVPAIIGGTDASIVDYPFVVSIHRYEVHYCGGSIINPRFVLTAGHCIFNQTTKTIDVLVGSTNLNAAHQDFYNVEDIRLHEEYQYVTDTIAKNDIGVLKLTESIKYGITSWPVSLSRKHVQSETRGIIVGWGRTKSDGPPSNELQKLHVTTIANWWCQLLSLRRNIYKENVCTAPSIFKRRGACYGDSGSPLVDADDHTVQIGLLSWVHGNCASGVPDGYTRISVYYDWIQNATSDVSDQTTQASQTTEALLLL